MPSEISILDTFGWSLASVDAINYGHFGRKFPSTTNSHTPSHVYIRQRHALNKRRRRRRKLLFIQYCTALVSVSVVAFYIWSTYKCRLFVHGSLFLYLKITHFILILCPDSLIFILHNVECSRACEIINAFSGLCLVSLNLKRIFGMFRAGKMWLWAINLNQGGGQIWELQSRTVSV